LSGTQYIVRPEIGSVWVCFPAVQSGLYLHKLLSLKALRQFKPAQIGFVFSNRALLNAVLSDFEPRASDFRAKPGDWLCLALFFPCLQSLKYHKPLSLLILGQFAP
jgi:hypothetical protein